MENMFICVIPLVDGIDWESVLKAILLLLY